MTRRCSTLDADAFEALVTDELDELPDEMVDGLDNVVFVVEDRPEDGSLDLLGLYDGVALTERGDYGFGEMPDRIILYREPLLAICDDEDAYPAVIQRELDRYLPFLATTRILIAAVRAGVGRETAHEVIKEHAVAVALAMRERGAEPDLLDRLAADPRLPLDRVALDDALADKEAFTGAAADQVDRVVAAVDDLIGRYPEAAKYTSGAIL